jgi:GT2 family glycosyltransferase
MKLTIIIVNYNVKFFLEQCLLSVRKAVQHLSQSNPVHKAEIIVVDNNSVDSSVSMLQSKFPDVILIANKENKGFSVANNQAIHISKGEYVLLLNPDTVVEEYTFQKIIAFMDEHPEAGALGVKMIDGKGEFLPESKRGLPTPSIAFYKVFGLSGLFPKSSVFGKYHLGYLDKNKIHEVDILAGACMLIRKEALDKTGLLDENFFMYGEDIDISYRIQKAGYKNYYFPDTQIIHYKGESTKKSSVNYVFVFYRAMIIFAKKHFSQKNASLFTLFINIAIYLRASISIARRFIEKISLPLVDAVLLYSGLLLVKTFWERNEAIGHGAVYPHELLVYIFPVYVLLWISGAYVLKAYSRPFNMMKIAKGVLTGSILISIFYAFLDESLRFSRALIIIGSAIAFIVFLFNRYLFHFIRFRNFSFQKDLRIAVIGSQKETMRVANLLNDSNLDYSFLGFIGAEDNYENKTDQYIGNLEQLEEIIHIYKITELIFCSKDIPSSRIIHIMTKISHKEIIYKIAPEESLFVIGSNNKNEPGDFYTISIKLSIITPQNKLNKRIFDITTALLFLIFSPLLIWVQNSKAGFIENIFSVLSGKKSWIGYSKTSDELLPHIRQGVLECIPSQIKAKADMKRIDELNLIYARDYSVLMDIRFILGSLGKLGSPGK